MYKGIFFVVVLALLKFKIVAQNVGIGTTSPTARLHVEVPNGFSGPSFQVNVTGSNAPQMIILADGWQGGDWKPQSPGSFRHFR